MLQGVLDLLRDPGSLVGHGQRILDGESPEQLLDELAAGHVLPGIPDDQDTSDSDASDADTGFEDDAPVPEPILDSLGLW